MDTKANLDRAVAVAAMAERLHHEAVELHDLVGDCGRPADEARAKTLCAEYQDLADRMEELANSLRPAGYAAVCDDPGRTSVVVRHEASGEVFHLAPPDDMRDLPGVARSAVAALMKRLAEARQAGRRETLAQYVAQHGNRLWVTVSDSIAAGNCDIGTAQFVTDVRRAVGATGELGACRADVLLGLRDDAYTRRAVYVAAVRCGA